jgi:hypothetical protein
MKTLRIFCLTAILLGYQFRAGAQLTPASVFTNNELIWYGLDFTEARFIGTFDEGFNRNHVSANELISTYMPAWNRLVLEEPMNFNLQSTFRKSSVYYDIRPVESLNARIKAEGIVTYNSYVLMKDRLAAMVKAYPEGDKKEGLGLVFIVESFDKSYRKGNYWIVFFDIRSRKILLSDYCSGAPVGFGLRNYWAGSLKHVLNEVRFLRYDMWKKNAMRENPSVVVN